MHTYNAEMLVAVEEYMEVNVEFLSESVFVPQKGQKQNPQNSNVSFQNWSNLFYKIMAVSLIMTTLLLFRSSVISIIELLRKLQDSEMSNW